MCGFKLDYRSWTAHDLLEHSFHLDHSLYRLLAVEGLLSFRVVLDKLASHILTQLVDLLNLRSNAPTIVDRLFDFLLCILDLFIYCHGVRLEARFHRFYMIFVDFLLAKETF